MASDPSTTADSSITAVKTLLSKSSLGSGTDTDESSTINNIPVHDGTSHSIFQHPHTLTRMPFLHFPIIYKAETNT